ncbi:hypothetical protein DPEC_G00188690 [Dallia pectoralis]|uniref:Uncharacterized protein n=1 Tax=Dallia pectoralis TaxID=75939 RepID=A0ACC2GC10_DALPE|nr:hypothetical protein DPEC_G00188690 [Dallia pectoralis]
MASADGQALSGIVERVNQHSECFASLGPAAQENTSALRLSLAHKYDEFVARCQGFQLQLDLYLTYTAKRKTWWPH